MFSSTSASALTYTSASAVTSTSTSTSTSTDNIISECGFSIGDTVILKSEHLGEEYLTRFVVTPKREILPITPEQNEALNKFLNKHSNTDDSSSYNIVIGETSTNYKFQRKMCVSFIINDEQDCNTIIITSPNVVKKFLNGELPSYFNPIWLHNYEEQDHNKTSLYPMRSISTYGFIEHIPHIETVDLYTKKIIPGLEYIIFGINSEIPNQKSVNTGSTGSIHLHLEPKINLNMDEEIYWFVDCTNNTICQYEDGVPFINLSSIESKK